MQEKSGSYRPRATQSVPAKRTGKPKLEYSLHNPANIE